LKPDRGTVIEFQAKVLLLGHLPAIGKILRLC